MVALQCETDYVDKRAVLARPPDLNTVVAGKRHNPRKHSCFLLAGERKGRRGGVASR